MKKILLCLIPAAFLLQACLFETEEDLLDVWEVVKTKMACEGDSLDCVGGYETEIFPFTLGPADMDRDGEDESVVMKMYMSFAGEINKIYYKIKINDPGSSQLIKETFKSIGMETGLFYCPDYDTPVEIDGNRYTDKESGEVYIRDGNFMRMEDDENDYLEFRETTISKDEIIERCLDIDDLEEE